MSEQDRLRDQRPMTSEKESVSAQTTSSTSSRNAHPTDLTSMQPQGYSTRSTGQPPQQATLEEVLKERRDVSRIQHPDQGAQFTISTTHSFPILSTGVPGTVTAPTIQSLMNPRTISCHASCTPSRTAVRSVVRISANHTPCYSC